MSWGELFVDKTIKLLGSESMGYDLFLMPDGGKALFRALGLEKLGEAAGKIIRSRENRKKLLNGGKTGRKILALCLTVIVSRVMTALLLLAGVCAMVWSFCS